MAFKSFVFKVFGWGKNKEEKLPARSHPYDDVSDNQVEDMKSARPPRVHPYDEVADAQLMAGGGGRPGKGQPQQPPRVHPYEEVSEDQLAVNRRQKQQQEPKKQQQQQQQQPRLHPYEDVSDATLEANRSQKPVAAQRHHNYDEVDLDRTMSKVNRPVVVNGKKQPPPDLNYVEVDVQAASAARKDGNPRSRAGPNDVVYSEVRASAAGDAAARTAPRK